MAALKRILNWLASPLTPSATGSHSETPLRILVGASLILPIALFCAAGVISYQAHFEEARDRLAKRGRSRHLLVLDPTHALDEIHVPLRILRVLVAREELPYVLAVATREIAHPGGGVDCEIRKRVEALEKTKENAS